VEHRALIAEAEQAAAANLRRTYLTLGLAVEGARLEREEGFTACVGSLAHPVCNFALELDLQPWSAARLRDLAWARGQFHVYAQGDDRPAHRQELLERQAFRLAYRLVHMASPPRDPGAFPALRPVVTADDRHGLATFMGAQFSVRQPAVYRAEIARATASATDLDLFELVDRGSRVGGVMVCADARTVGVYNLCVAASKRGRGYGRSIVAWAQAYALQLGCGVSLQCDAGLATWYETQGFERVGVVNVYALDKMQATDIMG
jgi:GNAT superfamily N-acetyltransferase